ncbi:MAG: response regulator [Anaerolineae bacterium]|nr:response regulator [Anaerolineae bacterium]
MTKQHILIVDDDIDALRLIGLMLERAGYHIIAASSGQQAISKAVKEQPALIILDIMMPDVDGYQVAAQLRKHPATTGVPILMFTAKTSITDKVASFQAGADDYLTKPIQPQALISHVETLLAQKNRTSEISDGKIICFLPTKGGVGNTTLSLNTAIELRRQFKEQKIVLLELRNGGATLGLHLGMSMRTYLQPLLEQPLASVNRDTINNAIIQHTSGIHLLLSSANPVGADENISKDFVRTLFYHLNTDYDYVLVDTAPFLGEANQEALRLSSLIMLSVEPTHIGLAMAQKMLDGLNKHHISPNKTEPVVIHRMPAGAALEINTIESALQSKVIANIPYEPEMAYQSILNNRPMKLRPHSLISQQVRLVVQSIVEHH